MNKYTATNNHYGCNKEYPNRIVTVTAKNLHEAGRKIVDWYNDNSSRMPYLKVWIDNGCWVFINDAITNLAQCSDCLQENVE